MTVWRMAMRDGNTKESMWERCRDMGIAAYTYDYLDRVDLSAYKKNGPRPEGWQYLKGSAPSSFIKLAFEMKKGDIIYVKEGPMIVGRGVLKGGYRFIGNKLTDSQGYWWSHAVPVAWDKDFKPVRVLLGAEPCCILELKGERLAQLEAAVNAYPAQYAEIEEEEVLKSRCGGQGYGLNAAERCAVEERAMKAAIKYFKKEGYEVQDAHHNSSYDLTCRKGKQTWYIEVKGTTGRPEKIFLTKNEVQHAQKHPSRTALFILHGIRLKKDTLKATGGVRCLIKPWCPEEAALEALQYSYTLPAG